LNTFLAASPRGDTDPYVAPLLDAEAVTAAGLRLRAAQIAWAARPIADRVAVLRRWAVAMGEQREAIIAAVAADTGRALLAAVELEGSLRRIESWCAQAPEMLARESSGTSVSAPSVNYIHQRVPYGLVGVISPWNFPLLLTLTDAIPALLAGNAVLAKPSEITPRFVAPLQASLAAVPELADVFELVTGTGETGAAVVEVVDAICFTGSVATGRKVGAQAGDRLIPAFLELGGKDPLLVLADADLDMAVATALRSSVISTGQACQSIERVYVHESLYADFVSALVAAARQVEPNLERIDRGHIGPFIDTRQAAKVQAQIDEAVAAGATLHCGGVVRRGEGAWCFPAVLTDLHHNMLIYREETFGPVLPIMPFSDDAEAIALANDTQFGLSAARPRCLMSRKNLLVYRVLVVREWARWVYCVSCASRRC